MDGEVMSEKKETDFSFYGFTAAHGYKTSGSGLGDVRVEVLAVRDGIDDKTEIVGEVLSHINTFPEGEEGPFDLEVFAYNALEKRDYVLKILGMHVKGTGAYVAKFKAHGLIPWKPTRKIYKKEKIMKINPLNDQVLLKRLKPEEKTESGLIIPVVAQEKQVRCEVVATGRGRVLDNGNLLEPQVKTGDIVLLDKWGGREVNLGDDEMIFVREEDILAVVE